MCVVIFVHFFILTLNLLVVLSFSRLQARLRWLICNALLLFVDTCLIPTIGTSWLAANWNVHYIFNRENILSYYFRCVFTLYP